MAFTYTGGKGSESGDSNQADTTHGLTINSGDLVCVYLNYNSSTITCSPDQSGWTTTTDAGPGGLTATQVMHWKLAGGSEPPTYGFSLSASTKWHVLIKVFSYTDTTCIVDAAAETDFRSSTSNSITCGANLSTAVSEDAVSVAFGGKDNRKVGAEVYTTATTSFVSVIGDTANQACAAGHKIWTGAGGTFSGTQFSTADSSDAMLDSAYGIHIAFIEDAGGGGISIPVAVYHYNHNIGSN